jgi:hypothetical protein
VFDLFHRFGRLAQISLKSAYGFVQYHTIEEGRRALENLEGYEVKGRRIRKLFPSPSISLSVANSATDMQQILKSLGSRISRRRTSELAAQTRVEDATTAGETTGSETKVGTTTDQGEISRRAATSIDLAMVTMAVIVLRITTQAAEGGPDLPRMDAATVIPTADVVPVLTDGIVMSPSWSCPGGTVRMFPMCR